MKNKFLRLYHTLKYLKPIQYYYRGINTISRHLPLYVLEKCRISRELNLINSITSYEEYISTNTFNFLNISKKYSFDINWNDLNNGKLWLYHLCSFNYLGQKSITRELGLKLIHSFNEYPTKKYCLDPYPISLRLINTIKFFEKYNVQDDNFNKYLWRQTQILKRKLEYHLLGNHILENGFALLFSGVYFQDNKTISIAKKIIQEQLEEQILDDGAHFELSPMYHSIMLYRILDCYNLMINNEAKEDELIELLQVKAIKMLSWLRNISFSDGSYPHFNDSTNEIAPLPYQLFEYAERLNLEMFDSTLNDSGYRAINRNRFELRLDIGKMGPDYIPGHAHNDVFSFALNINDLPFIVDRGVSTYEAGELRLAEKSTFSHNTVHLIKEEQAEIWSSFRVGRRNTPNIVAEEEDFILGSYTYPRSKIVHNRRFIWSDECIQILDQISVDCDALASLHFHPGILVNIDNNIISTQHCKIKIEGAQDILLENYGYALGFNKIINSKKAVIKFNGELKSSILF